MARLKEAGWTEYQIRKHKKLSAATIKAIKTGYANVTVRSVGEICHMLGDVQPDAVLEYIPFRQPAVNDYTPKIQAQKRADSIDRFTDEWIAQGHTGFGAEFAEFLLKR